jgi:hypothetical protein
MCYSVESSIKTTLISFISIVYLLTSSIPHFQWLGITLIGWCGMQFDELLLWLTNPRKGCTKWNKIITMTLIPLTLLSQVLCSLWGSLYVYPWKKMSNLRKNIMIGLTVICILIVLFIHFYKPDKICTLVSPQGHLKWLTKKSVSNNALFPAIWASLILLPFLLFWRKSFLIILLLCILPTFGYQYGSKYTDTQGSIWCYYTSYTGIIACIALFLQKNNIYSII